MRILGHRGASHDAPENTLDAFRLALDQGADGVELDARLCGSGEVVVFHDARLERLTGASGRVADVPWSALARLEVRAGPRGAAPGRIPLLAEVLEALPRTALINVELKCEDLAGTRVAPAAGALLAAGRHEDHVVVSSFDPRCLLRLLLGSPPAPARPAAGPRPATVGAADSDGPPPRPGCGAPRGDPRHRGGHPALARRPSRGGGVDCGRAGRRPPTPRLGVDACITNRPGVLRAALG